jgi:small conductance mechanosensitive channel
MQDIKIQDSLLLAQQIIVNFGLKLVGAFLLWFLGRWLIGKVVTAAVRALTAKQLDPTLQRYLASVLKVVLNIVLVIGILGFFGFETTSFAALIAAAGVAIGAAWAGLLSNFAAGAFLMVLRPFKVGDSIECGSVSGTVQEIGLFSTTLLTADNVPTYVNNSRIMGDTLRNFSDAPHRRVDRTAQVDHGTDPMIVMATLRQRLAQIPNVLAEPAPQIEILDLNDTGVALAVRPYCKPQHYAGVFFATNALIREVLVSTGAAAAPSAVETVAAAAEHAAQTQAVR